MEAHLIEIGSEKAVDHIKQGPKSGWRSLLPLGLVLLAASTRLSWHSALMSVPALFVSDALKTESLSATEDPGYSFPLKGAADGNVWAYYRLPTHIWPEAYRITLATELDQDGGEEISKDDLAKLEDLKDSRNAASRHGDFEFAGSVEMDFSVVNETDFMVLNSAELLLDTAEIAVRGRKSDSAQWTEPKFHAVPRNSTATEEQLFLRFASPSFNPPANTTPAILEPGTVYTLRISFKGKLGESLLGFYRSEYFRHGRTRYLASTQFEVSFLRIGFLLKHSKLKLRHSRLIVNGRPKSFPVSGRAALQGQVFDGLLYPSSPPLSLQHASNLGIYGRGSVLVGSPWSLETCRIWSNALDVELPRRLRRLGL